MLAIDTFLVIFEEQTSLQIPQEDLSIILARMGLVENLGTIIPKLIQHLEESTNEVEAQQTEKYLERAFEVLEHLAAGN